jgi:hypothetical protein
MSAFYPHTETLLEAEFKGDRLTNLREDISKQSSIQAASWLLPLLLNNLTVRIKNKNSRNI